MIRASTSCAADDHSAALREWSRRNTKSATPHRPASGCPRVDVLDQHTPFAADVSDEAGPDTTGATAGHVDETDLLDPSQVPCVRRGNQSGHEPGQMTLRQPLIQPTAATRTADPGRSDETSCPPDRQPPGPGSPPRHRTVAHHHDHQAQLMISCNQRLPREPGWRVTNPRSLGEFAVLVASAMTTAASRDRKIVDAASRRSGSRRSIGGDPAQRPGWLIMHWQAPAGSRVDSLLL